MRALLTDRLTAPPLPTQSAAVLHPDVCGLQNGFGANNTCATIATGWSASVRHVIHVTPRNN
jgi:hypothetical protein